MCTAADRYRVKILSVGVVALRWRLVPPALLWNNMSSAGRIIYYYYYYSSQLINLRLKDTVCSIFKLYVHAHIPIKHNVRVCLLGNLTFVTAYRVSVIENGRTSSCIKWPFVNFLISIIVYYGEDIIIRIHRKYNNSYYKCTTE